ncbi:BTB/POZ domain-containing protein 6, partial [Stegodyphus mimosarum]
MEHILPTQHQHLVQAGKWQLNMQTTEEALLHMYKHNLLTDVTLHVQSDSGDLSLSVHKLILASRSPKFFDMFFGNDCRVPSNVLIIRDVSVCAMELLIWYIYSGKLDIQNEEDLPGIAKAACIYEIENLKQACKNLLSNYAINVRNVCFLLDAANVLKDNNVRMMCLQLVKREWKSVLESPEFLAASKEIVLDIVCEQNLEDTSKTEFIEGIIRWIQSKRESDRDLFSWVDMSSMTDRKFLGIIKTYPSFFTKEEISSILLNLSCPEEFDPPHWFNASTNVRFIEFENPEIRNFIERAPVKFETDCNTSFRKCSFHGEKGFSASFTVQFKFFESFPDSMSLVMMELAFGSGFVPKENLRLELSYRTINDFKKHKIRYWIIDTNKNYYIITENCMELENNCSFFLSLRIHVQNLRKWGCCKPVSNGQYLGVSIPSGYSYNIYHKLCEAQCLELVPLSDWLVFLDSTNGNKYFVITNFFFDSFINHQKLLQKLHL